MARLYMVSVTHGGNTHWATIVNYPAAPATFEVKFYKESGFIDLPSITLERKNGKLELSKDSMVIEEGFLKAIVNALENHRVEKELSL